MRFAKRYSSGHKIVRDLRGQHTTILNRLLEDVPIHGESAHQFRQDLHRRDHGIQGIEERRLILLKISVITQGQGLERRQQID